MADEVAPTQNAEAEQPAAATEEQISPTAQDVAAPTHTGEEGDTTSVAGEEAQAEVHAGDEEAEPETESWKEGDTGGEAERTASAEGEEGMSLPQEDVESHSSKSTVCADEEATVTEEGEAGTEQADTEEQAGTEIADTDEVGSEVAGLEVVGSEEPGTEETASEEETETEEGTGTEEGSDTEEAGTEENESGAEEETVPTAKFSKSLIEGTEATGIIQSGSKQKASIEVGEVAERKYDRQALLDEYHKAMASREIMQKYNRELQYKLVMHIRKTKPDDKREVSRSGILNQEQRYLRFMVERDRLEQQVKEDSKGYTVQFEEWEERSQKQRRQVDIERLSLVDLKRQVAQTSAYSRSGRAISPQEIEQYMATDNKKESEVITMRLENIKLKYKILKVEQTLKSKEELGTGLHLIDFEQLKVENQSLNEKIEERNEELRKLRCKISSTVQMLTHLKEKREFVKGENHVKSGNLQKLESHVSGKRDILSHTKHSRDMLLLDNHRLTEKSGLLGNHTLLRDYEERRTQETEMKTRLQQLQNKYAELNLAHKRITRNIEWMKCEHS